MKRAKKMLHMIALSVIIDLLEIEGHLNGFMIIMLINSVKYDNICQSTVTYTLFICCMAKTKTKL